MRDSLLTPALSPKGRGCNFATPYAPLPSRGEAGAQRRVRGEPAFRSENNLALAGERCLRQLQGELNLAPVLVRVG